MLTSQPLSVTDCTELIEPVSFCVALSWYRFPCNVRWLGSEPALYKEGSIMSFKAGKDYSDVRIRYQEDELVVERAKCAAEIIKSHIKGRGISQAQYCSVFGFKSRNPIHKRFLAGKVTLIDLIRIVSTPGFKISVDDALHQAITEIEYIDQSVVPVEEPKTERVELKKAGEGEPPTEKPSKRPAILDQEIDMSLLADTPFARRFSNMFSVTSDDEAIA